MIIEDKELGAWIVSHENIKNLSFEYEYMANIVNALVENGCFIDNEEATQMIKPLFRLLGIESRWSA